MSQRQSLLTSNACNPSDSSFCCHKDTPESAAKNALDALAPPHIKFRDHCADCGSRRRNIMDKCSGDLAEWVRCLPETDPDGYSNLV